MKAKFWPALLTGVVKYDKDLVKCPLPIRAWLVIVHSPGIRLPVFWESVP